jgi:hypothetical protein
MAAREHVLSVCHTEFFQLFNDPQGSNAVRAVTNTVIAKANMVGRKDNSY